MKKSLKDNLPLYLPPESVWENIARELHENPLREGLDKLPTYEPPVQTWDEIKTQLEQPRKIGWRYAAAAAVVVAIGVYLTLQLSEEKASISYSEEKLTPKTAVTSTETIDRQYARLQVLCQSRVTVCEKPEFKSLKQELDDLTAAGNQLKEALGAYNTDAALSAQLSEIEQERADILRKLNERI